MLNPWPNADDDPSHIVTQDEREAIGQEAFELAMLDLGVQQIHACGMHLDQNFVIAQLRVGHFANQQATFAAITINIKCFHRNFFFLSRDRRLLLIIFEQSFKDEPKKI